MEELKCCNSIDGLLVELDGRIDRSLVKIDGLLVDRWVASRIRWKN